MLHRQQLLYGLASALRPPSPLSQIAGSPQPRPHAAGQHMLLSALSTLDVALQRGSSAVDVVGVAVGVAVPAAVGAAVASVGRAVGTALPLDEGATYGGGGSNCPGI